jgi:hypothetical protein
MLELEIFSDPVEKFTDWEQFQSLASEIILPRIQINFGGGKQIKWPVTSLPYSIGM